MDVLGHLLSGPRAREAFLLRVAMNPPWAMRIEDDPALTIVAVTQGSLWLTGLTEEPTRLDTGDVLLVRGDPPYTVGDHPATPVQVRVGPGAQCFDPDGCLVDQSMALGVRTWGNSRDGADVFLVGTWEAATEVGRPLLSALPEYVVLRRAEWDPRIVDLLSAEIGREAPGQEVVLDRLLDLLLVSAVRSWLGGQQAVPGLSARDPVVDHALRLMHHAPEHGWTIASLAAQAGVSRAALARRFTDVLGEPPMTYLTRWRLALAADLLASTDHGIERIAREVGYGSPFALSAAFKRVRGVSPQQHRRTARAEAQAG
jgi:AraC-like DNA-binding protein